MFSLGPQHKIYLRGGPLLAAGFFSSCLTFHRGSTAMGKKTLYLNITFNALLTDMYLKHLNVHL